jgi:hypothetical protein
MDTIYQALELAAALDLSDERDQWERLVEQAFRDGYRAAEAAHADDYQRGLIDGALVRKRAQHELVEMARIDAAQWGPAGREHFGDPRPGDYPGGAAGLARTRAAWLAEGLGLGPGPEWVHLSGPVVHYGHVCKPVCHQYKPGWHTIADAITILATLPGDYAATIAGLRATASTHGSRAA